MRVVSSIGAARHLPKLRVETSADDVILHEDLLLVPVEGREPLDDLYHVWSLSGFLLVAVLDQLEKVLPCKETGAITTVSQLFKQYMINLLDSRGKQASPALQIPHKAFVNRDKSSKSRPVWLVFLFRFANIVTNLEKILLLSSVVAFLIFFITLIAFIIIPSVLRLGILSNIVSELEELDRNFFQRFVDQ